MPGRLFSDELTMPDIKRVALTIAVLMAGLGLAGGQTQNTTNGDNNSGPAKTSDLSGTVLAPDGRPVSGARVAFNVLNEVLTLTEGRLDVAFDQKLLTETDEEGQFILTVPADFTALVAADKRGYAELEPATITNGLTIRLQPWGEIRGTLRIENHPGTNQILQLTSRRWDQAVTCFASSNVTTGRHGEFVMTYAPPGEQAVMRFIPNARGGFVVANPNFIRVKAGGITEATIGGEGRAVVGQAKLRDNSWAMNWMDVSFELTKYSPAQAVPIPYLIQHSYIAPPATNGTFHFEDVLPGTYHLVAEPAFGARPVTPLADKVVTIPAQDATDTGLFDIGTVDVRALPPL
jgi:hypothetical protein